jgi:hypothetical protein
MDKQEMMKAMLAETLAKMEADRKTDKEEMLAEMQEMKANQAKADANMKTM